jgi:hypothetical protein
MSAGDPMQATGSSKVTAAEGDTAIEPVKGATPSVVVWLAAALAALVAGLAAWLATELGAFRVEPGVEKTQMIWGEAIAVTARTRTIAAIREVSWSLGTFGALLGAGMGLAGALSRRSWRRALVVAGIGGAAAALAGILMPWVVLPPYHQAEMHAAGDLTRSVLMHLELWVLLGAAAGLAWGIGQPEPRRWLATLVGGAVGAALGILLYDVLGAFLFPLAETGKPVSAAWQTRLMAFLLVGGSTVFGVLAAAKTPDSRTSQGARPAAPPPS